MPSKRKVIIEKYPLTIDGRLRHDVISSEAKVRQLKQEYIYSIIIITSGPVDADSFREFVIYFKNSGFRVRTIYLDIFDENAYQNMYNEVQDMYKSLIRGGCLIVSYGDSYAPVLYASFLTYTGKEANETIDKIKSKYNGFLTGQEEENFIINFNKKYGQIKLPAKNKEKSIPASEKKKDKDFVERRISEKHFHEKLERESTEKKITPKEQIVAEGQITGLKSEKEDIVQEVRPERVKQVDLQEIKDIKIHEELPSPKEIKIDKEFEAASEREVDEEKRELEDAVQVEPIKPMEEKAVPEGVVQESDSGNKIEVKKDDPGSKEEKAANEKKIEAEIKKYKSRKNKNKTSLKVKLILITSIIIVISFAGMIFIASYFFKEDNKARVQENNLRTSEIIALNVQTDFQSLIEKSRYRFENVDLKKDNISGLLLNDKDILYTALARRNSNNLNINKFAYNYNLMNQLQMSETDIKAANKELTGNYLKSFSGIVTLNNSSSILKQPVISLSFPLSSGNYNQILICYIKMDRFLAIFKSKGIIKSFMVNDSGDVIAHEDRATIFSGTNYADNPIVKMMIKSKEDNGNTSYKSDDNIVYMASFKKINIANCGVIALVEEEKALQAVYKIQRQNIYLMGIILTVVILIVFFFAKTLTRPIIRLVAATKRIKDGDYNIHIRSTTRDEIGELTDSFMEMGQGLAEREKIKTAFGKFVNPELAKMVLKDEIKLGGETKNAVILFSDIRSFTAISEKLQPFEVVEFLNQYMTKMVACIEQTKGIVDKFIGDAIMAVWGVPVSKGNDIVNAVEGALLMRASLLDFNKDRGDEKHPVINIGCGINAGPVLAGQIGSEQRMEYTVIGDAVNLASRIEALNKPFGTDILVSEETYQKTEDLYYVEKMTPIRVKGKETAQQIYAVLGRKSDQDSPKTIDELRQLLGTKELIYKRRKEDSEKEEKYEILS